MRADAGFVERLCFPAFMAWNFTKVAHVGHG
jgi:hypothetical protein